MDQSDREGSGRSQEDTMFTDGNGHHSSMHPLIQSQIGKHLRAAYDDVVNEPVPQRFIDLLEQLEQSSTKTRRS
ncbi:NepR family anti-sigma factor [Afifella sp. IM 167]|uniref:NepR family anti-sigma factor n=1 Tax=Afifella sp. IM 167 TaxID=2033586 RepID=UPI001CCD1433|nr:NepR family anti-sigma factor [Afifella sp. IM 167]